MARPHDHATTLAQLARQPRLALLVDLDGTLIPFAPTLEQAVLTDDVARRLRILTELGVQIIVISGRPRTAIDPLRRLVPGAWWFAEHASWRHDGTEWSGPARVNDPGALDGIAAQLLALAATVDGARVERKSLSCALHWRQVSAADRAVMVPAAELAIEEWLETHLDHERLDGVQMVEVRPRACHKGVAVTWARQRLADTCFLALGDDLTDEDMFRALTDRDLAVAVGRPDRLSHARVFVADVPSAHQLLEWLAAVRGLHADQMPPIEDIDADARESTRAPFVVIANRMPSPRPADRQRQVGGLVAALEPVLEHRGGVWLGWSGEIADREPSLVVDAASRPARACFDFPASWHEHFYGGLCNRALWPLFHGFPGRVRYRDEDWVAYVDANATFARLAGELAEDDATVWVHDYQLLLTGAAMRHRGHTGPIGLFLHVPFPTAELFETFPWASEILRAMLAYDVVGFHTQRYASNFIDALGRVLGVDATGGTARSAGRTTRIEAIPIGIEPAAFRPDPAQPTSPEVDGLCAALGDRKLLLGVDRLDYSKGVPERLAAFERLLDRHPEWRRRVTFVQVSVPSRSDVPEYAELRQQVEYLVGHINGRFGDADWSPVRYLYRSYTHEVLSQLYRAADVALVTPLRDGMNLVAKEFVAAQDPGRPGVLVLSRFAGAAESLKSAVLTNPFHAEGMADDFHRALSMPEPERRERHGQMLSAVERDTSHAWAERFLGALSRLPLKGVAHG
ncbi:MAG: trehalose-phosphatase [Deltaproteobacteria bacterium]|nr:trehalose-phosphatase [Kofleriaceae bacterium]